MEIDFEATDIAGEDVGGHIFVRYIVFLRVDEALHEGGVVSEDGGFYDFIGQTVLGGEDIVDLLFVFRAPTGDIADGPIDFFFVTDSFGVFAFLAEFAFEVLPEYIEECFG